MTSIDYIVENFLTFDQLAAASGVSVDQLQEMIAANCLPGPAYEVTGTYKVQSVFGLHEEVVSRAYYPTSHVTKAQAVASSAATYPEQSETLKRAFYTDYKKILLAKNAAAFGLAHLFDAAGQIVGPKADLLLAQEWQHYLDGTYGLCTRCATATEIATKESMIAKITCLTDKLEQDRAAGLLDDLAQAVDELDAVSAPFAPHEVARSSRGRHIDAVRRKYLTS